MSVNSDTSLGIVGLFSSVFQSALGCTIPAISVSTYVLVAYSPKFKLTLFPSEIESTFPSHDRVCRVTGPASQEEPLYVNTCPCVPVIVKLSARTAVPWNVSPYTSLKRISALPISHIAFCVGILCPSVFTKLSTSLYDGRVIVFPPLIESC